jgi:hypothetical protein
MLISAGADPYRLGTPSARMQEAGFGWQANAQAESAPPGELFWEVEGPPTRFMRPAAFQEGFERRFDRSIAEEQARRTGGDADGIYRTLRGGTGAPPPSPDGRQPPRSHGPKKPAPQAYRLGGLSEEFESSNKGSETISSGRTDPGGASYGVHQIASDVGTLKDFLEYMRKRGAAWPRELGVLKPGSKEFNAKWREIAARDPQGFRDAQYVFLKETHYDKTVMTVAKDARINLDKRHNAIREAVWSSAVQHSGASSFLTEAVRLADRRAPRGSPEYDAILIKELYAARRRYVSKEAEEKTDPEEKRQLQNVVRNRYPEEEKRALLLLER